MTVIASLGHWWHYHWSFIHAQLPALGHGLERTLKVSAIGIAGAYGIGVVLGALRAHRVPVLSQIAAIYVEVIRNTPILVQIFLFYYGLPELPWHPVRVQPVTVAWLSVMVWGGAFNTENFRAGFEAVPVRYREAGRALGFGWLGTFANVTFPIGARIALPSSINTSVSVLKNTSLLTAIGYAELTNTAYSIQSETFRATDMYIALGVIYLAVVWTLSVFIRVIESRLALPERS
jgi:polar amino acid transport system permease protein